MPEHASHIEFNPYLAPESAGFQSRAHNDGTTARHLSPLKAGMISWASTGIAGAIFGFGIFGFIGAAFGFFIAGAAAVPVAAVIFVALRIIWPAGVPKNVAVISAALCGCMTGFGSTALMFSRGDLVFPAIAGVVGGIVPAIGVGLMSFSRYSYRELDVPPAVWADLETQLNDVTAENEGRKG